jgi:hypothetical protein
MRKPMTMVLFASGIMFVSAMAEAKIKFERFHREITIEVPTIKEISVIKPKLEVKVKMPVVKNHSTFLDAIGFRESSNNYKAVNQFGYLGKYQFGRKTLNAIGFEDISNREFLANPSIQEEAMLILLKRNKHTLRREIKKYVGKTINGIYITESGILAAAHLGGAGNVKKFFRNGKNFADGNGTKMTSYMKRFANYQLNI